MRKKNYEKKNKDNILSLLQFFITKFDKRQNINFCDAIYSFPRTFFFQKCKKKIKNLVP
jgi:hypothetical protein